MTDILTNDEVDALTFLYRDFECLVASHRAQAARIKEQDALIADLGERLVAVHLLGAPRECGL